MTGVVESTLEEDRAGGKLALLPQRHPNHDLFICDVLDAIPKDDMASMEHPIFSLATKPDTRILRYEHKNVVVEIAPSVRGLATIYDKDILIYCVSQLMAKKNAGEPLAQTLHLNAHDLLVWTNRETSGDAYRRLKDAFERLRGTTITTNIKTNGEDEVQGFGLIESFKICQGEGVASLCRDGTAIRSRHPIRAGLVRVKGKELPLSRCGESKSPPHANFSLHKCALRYSCPHDRWWHWSQKK